MPIDPTAVASALTGHDWQRAAALLLPLLAWALRRYAAPTTWAHRPAGAAAISLGLALVAAFAPLADSHALTRQSAISAGTVALLSLAAVANPTQAAIKAAPTLAGVVVFLACGVASASTPPATPTIAPSGPVVTLPADAAPALALSPAAAAALAQAEQIAAAAASIKATLGVPSGVPIPASFWNTAGGKVVIGVLAIVGAGTSALEAWASARAQTLPASSPSAQATP